MANEMNDLISRKALLAEYDRVHIGPPGGARKLMEDAPAVDVPHWATEAAYKNGYEQGKKDALKWIPVEERLPEGGQIVLALGLRHATSGMFRGTTSKPNIWHWKGGFYKEVTRWMPIPEAPKKSVAKKCDGCGCVISGRKRHYCPECVKRIQSETAKKRNLNKQGNDAYSAQQKRKKEDHG